MKKNTNNMPNEEFSNEPTKGTKSVGDAETQQNSQPAMEAQQTQVETNEVLLIEAEVVETVPSDRLSDNPAVAPTENSIANPALSDSGSLRIWHFLLVALLVILADLTIYRGHGYSGIAAFFLISPILLLLGSHWRFHWSSFLLVGSMLALASVRLIWSGSPAIVICGTCLLIGYAMTLNGEIPFVLEAAHFCGRIIKSGFTRIARCITDVANSTRLPQMKFTRFLNVLMPIAALVIFSFIFLFANPDLFHSVSTMWEEWTDAFSDWIADFSITEPLFWCAVALISLGMMRPYVASLNGIFTGNTKQVQQVQQESPLVPAIRNTLVALILLFSAYLVLEFSTLWKRDFPEGFYYAGYAHKGAAWLTIALALTTATLSAIFQGNILRDPRLSTLKNLSWVWSALNLLLAIAVYNRLLIYVAFNGMTVMRTVGFFGTTCVAIGLLIVLYKITKSRSFQWVVQRHLLTVAVAIFVFVMAPVDYLVNQYNVKQVLQGELAPSVQIAMHPISDEGLLALTPLIDCENKTIREGVFGLLSTRYKQLRRTHDHRKDCGWTAYQHADQQVLSTIEQALGKKTPRSSTQTFEQYETDFKSFREYSYQWY